ncbi:MAG: hypothetical protein M3T49_03825 [Candidatus Eremiobacteraeota bacterium]|nr:hypothetical protein [Candidatus Eremiobacteraeota bacterium]
MIRTAANPMTIHSVVLIDDVVDVVVVVVELFVPAGPVWAGACWVVLVSELGAELASAVTR